MEALLGGRSFICGPAPSLISACDAAADESDPAGVTRTGTPAITARSRRIPDVPASCY